MCDGWEVKYGLNPTDSSDANSDKDGDGLTNGDEVNVYGTVPTVRNDRYAILVGINDFQNINDLSFCCCVA